MYTQLKQDLGGVHIWRHMRGGLVKRDVGSNGGLTKMWHHNFFFKFLTKMSDILPHREETENKNDIYHTHIFPTEKISGYQN